eukprot:PhF_6_TR1067/c0_g1_i1/m.2241
MAHYLSEVTHAKLDQRREQIVPTYTKGLRCVHDFTAFMRCAEVVPRHTISGHKADFVVWSGEQDGTIAIRSGIQGDEIFQIEKKEKVFVYCLLHHNNFMWAGLSDGYLRVFDVRTFDLVFETKPHAGGILAIIFACGYIFTGGYDWQILQWEPEEIRVVPRGQYSGHQNAVRCFAADGSLLFSGGDDFAIRCWDIDVGQEKMAPWPVVGHRGGIRALVIMEVYLFSASQDGTVKVWNTQTGQLVRVLEKRDNPYTSLMRDDSSFRLWTGNADGTINLWNGLTLEPIASMTDHSGSFVVAIKSMIRVNAMKAWSVGQDGSVCVWFSETDGGGNTDYKLIKSLEEDQQKQVEMMRTAILRNYSTLETRRMELLKLENRDENRKANSAKAFAAQNLQELKKVAFGRLLKWRIQKRLKSKLSGTALASFNHLTSELRHSYYGRWLKFTNEIKDYRRKKEISSALSQATENGTMVTYLHLLLQYAKIERQRSRREAAGGLLLLSTTRGLRCRMFNQWKRFVVATKTKNSRDTIVQALGRINEESLMAAYWKLLKSSVRIAKRQNGYAQQVGTLLRSCESGILRWHFSQWTKYVKRRKITMKRRMAADNLLRGTTRGLRLIYYRKLFVNLIVKKATPLMDQYVELQARIEEMQRLLSSQNYLTEDQLEKELKRLYDEVGRIQAENEKLDQEIRQLELQQKKLRAELRKENYLDPTKTPEQQLEQAMYLLKAKGVNCRVDFTRVTDARSHGVSKAEDVFNHGVLKVQRVCAKAVSPEHLKDSPESLSWQVSGEVLDRIMSNRKIFESALEGISDVVVAYDMMVYENKASWFDADGNFSDKHSLKAEMLQNFNVFLDFVVQHFKRCHDDVRVTGSASQRGMTPRSPRPPASPRLSSPRQASPAPASNRSASNQPPQGPFDRTSMKELVSFVAPPEAVVKVTNAVLILLDEPVGWLQAKKVLSHANFKDRILAVDPATVTPVQTAKLNRIVSSADFNIEQVKGKSVVAGELCGWVLGIYAQLPQPAPAPSTTDAPPEPNTIVPTPEPSPDRRTGTKPPRSPRNDSTGQTPRTPRVSDGQKKPAAPGTPSSTPSSSKIYLGFSVSDEIVKNGVVLKDVVPDGPAGVAGLQNGDVVTAFGGTAVSNNKQSFHAAIKLHATTAGKDISVVFFRSGTPKMTTLTVGSKN